MRRTYRFVEPSGVVACRTDAGETIEVPVFAGILKHPTADDLGRLLGDPAVLRKYTREALRRAPWAALRRFPRGWLVAALPDTNLPDARRKALELLLGASTSPNSDGPA